eukprot:TRINITY_DN7153_c0_g1_i1.p1 TRINITY_DN7153_c0_g1~~TRINITY_DN7153_c0_g1_i1.p1  ORF type:complete len:86 (+),score=0.49 TRINITY_DN7153_c0_g1_i1:65-322(+)
MIYLGCAKYNNGKYIEQIQRWLPVDLPDNIELEGIRISRNVRKTYSLKGFLIHRGTNDSGHYIAYCKSTKTIKIRINGVSVMMIE